MPDSHAAQDADAAVDAVAADAAVGDGGDGGEAIVLAGIDEAGYGPLLGPLLLGCAVLSVPPAPGKAAPNLWDVLADLTTKDSRAPGAKHRVVVCDSKLLHSPASIRPLEETVLSFAAAALGGKLPADAAEFVEQFSLLPPDADPDGPWASADALRQVALPRAALADKCALRGERLAAGMTELGVRLDRPRVRQVHVREFNQRVAALNNKSAAHLGWIGAIVRKLWQRHPHVNLVIDKIGGRDRYADTLRGWFPQAIVSSLGHVDAPARSRSGASGGHYGSSDPRTRGRGTDRAAAGGGGGAPSSSERAIARHALRDGDRTLDIVFAREAEKRSFAVALASCFAKYTRELYVEALNRHFAERVAPRTLKPTKGYVQDGRRYLEDLEALGVDITVLRPALVRDR